MTTDKNDKVSQQLQAYVRGELTEDEIQELRDAIEENRELSHKLDKLMFDGLLAADTDLEDITLLSEQKQRHILRKSKWRSRLSQVFFTTGGITALITLLFLVSQVFNYLWFWPATQDLQRVMSDVVSFTNPGLRTGSGGTSGGLFFSMKMKYSLEEQVGREEKQAGIMENNVLLFRPQLKYAWNNGFHQNKLYFQYPTAEKAANADGIDVHDQGWRTLEKLPEGTVAQIAISFDKLMTHDEFFALIKKYDLETTWLAIATGQEVSEDRRAFGKGDVWGYDPDSHTLDYGGATIEVNGEGERRAQALIREMEYLVSKKKWAEPMLRDTLFRSDSKLAQRVDYLKQHGVRLYGAVLTGPAKELLKVKQEAHFTRPFVGQIDWWNWEQPNASGIEYSW